MIGFCAWQRCQAASTKIFRAALKRSSPSYFPAQNSALLALCREPRLTRLVHRRTSLPGCVNDPLLLGSDPLDSLILLVYLNHIYG